MTRDMRVFALNATREFGSKVAEHLDVPLSPHQEELFVDGEQYLRALTNVRGKDVFVIQSLYSDTKESITEKFTRLLFFVGSLRDASAERITVVIPYLGFYRQDRKTQSRAPITSKYVAMLLEEVGARRLLTMDVHSLAAMHNAFRKCVTDNLEGRNLLTDWMVEEIKREEQGKDVRDFVILSPDEGGIKRAAHFRKYFAHKLGRKVGMAYVDKNHEPGVGEDLTSAENIVGTVKDKFVITVDDMISSGGTLQIANNLVVQAGGQPWASAATHALCVGKCNQKLADIPRLVVTDTITSGRLEPCIMEKTVVLSAAKLFAQAIRRTHEGESISDLLESK